MDSLYDLLKEHSDWMFMISEGEFYIQADNVDWSNIPSMFPDNVVRVGSQYVHICTENAEEFTQEFLSLLKTKDLYINIDTRSRMYRYFCCTEKGMKSLYEDHMKRIEYAESELSSLRENSPYSNYTKYSS